MRGHSVNIIHMQREWNVRTDLQPLWDIDILAFVRILLAPIVGCIFSIKY